MKNDPENEETTLGEICEVQGGYSFESVDFRKEGVPLVRISNINDYLVKIGDNTVYLDKSFLKEFSEYEIKKGDILIALSGATTGKHGRYIDDEPALLNQRIGRLRKFNLSKVDPNYIFFWLNTLQKEIFSKAYGVAQPNISTNRIESFSIKLPSLETQREVISILEKVKQLELWRKESDKLVKDYLNSLFVKIISNFPLNKNLTLTKLRDVCNMITVGIVVKPASYYVPQGIPALRSLNVRENGVAFDNFVYISEKNHLNSLAKSTIHDRDVLVVRSGVNAGTACVAPKEIDGANCIDLLIIRPNETLVKSEYLAYFFNNPLTNNKIRNVMTGSAQKHLNVHEVVKLDIPLSSIRIQSDFAEIVKKCQIIRGTQSQSGKRIDSLLNSIVKIKFGVIY